MADINKCSEYERCYIHVMGIKKLLSNELKWKLAKNLVTFLPHEPLMSIYLVVKTQKKHDETAETIFGKNNEVIELHRIRPLEGSHVARRQSGKQMKERELSYKGKK